MLRVVGQSWRRRALYAVVKANLAEKGSQLYVSKDTEYLVKLRILLGSAID